jgi:RNA polymerase sigma factor (sigma-70 family)
MQNWKKDRNYRKYENADGTVTYVIKAGGEDIEVSEAVYCAYAQSVRQLEYIERDLKRDRVLQDSKGKVVFDADGRPALLPEREVSLEKLKGEDWDYPADGPNPEDAALQTMEIEALRRCLDSLNQKDRALIQALFFEGKTEREYAAETGNLQQTVHARKRAVLAKLKKLLGNQK